MDYLTKWLEVFAVAYQTAATIARLLVEEIVSSHGVPTEILLDRGKSFLSSLMKEIVKLLEIHQTNITVYHLRQIAWWSVSTACSPPCWQRLLSKEAVIGTSICQMSYLLIMPVSSSNQLENLQSSYFMDETIDCLLNQPCLQVKLNNKWTYMSME